MRASSKLALVMFTSLVAAACAVAPIGKSTGTEDTKNDNLTGAKASSPDASVASKLTPTAATSCTSLKACAARVAGADATSFTKVAEEGDEATCTKALAQCKTEVTAAMDAGAPATVPTTAPTTTPPAGSGTNCNSLSGCCDLLAFFGSDDTATCDITVQNGDDSACNAALTNFVNEGSCF